MTETASVDGVVLVLPEAGPTLSQVPPAGLVTAAVGLNICADPSLAVTMTFCGDGAAPPMVAVKVRPVELRLSVGVPPPPPVLAGVKV